MPDVFIFPGKEGMVVSFENHRNVYFLYAINITQLLSLPWWRHQKETFSTSLALCEKNPSVTGGFTHKGQWRVALMFSLMYAWTSVWVNSWDAADLRRHGAHCDVTVMSKIRTRSTIPWNSQAGPLRSRQVSKAQNRWLEFSNYSEIWQASRQQCCRDACQISKR